MFVVDALLCAEVIAWVDLQIGCLAEIEPFLICFVYCVVGNQAPWISALIWLRRVDFYTLFAC